MLRRHPLDAAHSGMHPYLTQQPMAHCCLSPSLVFYFSHAQPGDWVVDMLPDDVGLMVGPTHAFQAPVKGAGPVLRQMHKQVSAAMVGE